MKIKSSKTLTHRPEKSMHSYTITPEMGVVGHFPTAVCEALIGMGAVAVTDKSKKCSAAKAQ